LHDQPEDAARYNAAQRSTIGALQPWCAAQFSVGNSLSPQSSKSGCVAVIMSQQSTQESVAVDATDLRRVVDGQVFRRSSCSRG
jgi:hypothetical protein